MIELSLGIITAYESQKVKLKVEAILAEKPIGQASISVLCTGLVPIKWRNFLAATAFMPELQLDTD